MNQKNCIDKAKPASTSIEGLAALITSERDFWFIGFFFDTSNPFSDELPIF